MAVLIATKRSAGACLANQPAETINEEGAFYGKGETLRPFTIWTRIRLKIPHSHLHNREVDSVSIRRPLRRPGHE